jgi:hypothetical protein
MTEQEKEYTILMAEFMGVTSFACTPTYINPRRENFNCNRCGCANPEKMKYHTSYDWLMPVWVKLRDMSLKDFSFYCRRNICDITSDLGLSISDKLISDVFKELAEGIKWLNGITSKQQ